MYSFYGGKQGRTYHIVARFDTLFINFDDKETYPELTTGATMSFQAGKRFQFSQGNNVNVACFVLVDLENITLSDVSSLEADGSIVRLHGMVNEFMKGGSYTDVNYGEYVIIDTILNMSHKNDDLNGLLYRRGFDYTEASNSPTRPVKADYWTEDDNHQSVFNLAGWTAAWRNYVTRPGGGAEYVGQIVGPQGDSPELRGLQWQTFETLPSTQRSSTTASRTPGYIPSIAEGEASTFHDVIQFGWSNIEDADGNIEGAYIAFDIPYTVHEFNLTSTDPYSTAGLVEDGASTGHNFYYKWDLTLPAGKKGNQIENLRIENDGSEEQPEKYLTYDIRSFESTAAGTVTASGVKFPWEVIHNIVSSSSTRTYFDWPQSAGTTAAAVSGYIYPFPNEEQYEDIYFMTQDTEIDSEKTYYILNENNEYEQVLNPVVEDIGTYYECTHNVPYNNFGYTLLCTVSGSVLPEDYPNHSVSPGDFIYGAAEESPAQWMVIVSTPETNVINQLEVSYESGRETSVFPFRQVDYFTIDPRGIIYVKYSNENPGVLHSIGSFRSISNIYIDEDTNQFVIQYNDGQSYSEKYIKQIDTISFDNNLDGTQTFKALYRGVPNTIPDEQQGGEKQVYTKQYEISSAMNTVVAINRKGDNIIILYSNPTYRKSFLDGTHTQGTDFYLLPYDGIGVDESTAGDDPQSQERVFVWVNFGPLGAQYHVFGDYTLDDVLTDIPDGFTDSVTYGSTLLDRAGWIISITSEQIVDNQTVYHTALYAYDYNAAIDDPEKEHYNEDKYLHGQVSGEEIKTYWYLLKDLDESSIKPQVSVFLGTLAQYQSTTALGDNGLGFIATETNHSHT